MPISIYAKYASYLVADCQTVIANINSTSMLTNIIYSVFVIVLDNTLAKYSYNT